MTRDEALISAALEMAARRINSDDMRWLSRCQVADAIRAIDPAEVLEKVVEAAMHLLSEYDAPNPVDDAVSKLRTALVACKEARDD